ncbi:zinc finger C2HC domain-containing protein 1A-like isoform X2 [Adelges cooleyi]|uniref:zinc finger C2HC domain-containing protein 1A-like isoform X2 n=1 Tax=Adelges cooleyi TaxID=133065 RepID=UPI0021803844|nr:zinc finger C2HC domain-containing protein 1A-like isoform X2 [Adelges cooleyi]XP_050424815.1 zinc finger C2HC domain-containing protein 1A-like isoform X2 [Adelges cooleyi]
MEQMDNTEELPYDNEVVELQPCKICLRTFRPNLLPRHTAVCEKNAKKRKVPFDSSRQRREGTDMASYLPRVNKSHGHDEVKEKPKKNWRAKHEELLRAVKAARNVQNEDSVPLSIKPADSQSCPHCTRNFGPKSYDRHVQFCKEKSQRISTTPITSTVAKERLEARIKYRAPLLRSQRTATKEKYSPKTKKTPPDVASAPIKVYQPIKVVRSTRPIRTTQPVNKVTAITTQMRQSSSVKQKKEPLKHLNGNKSAKHLPKKPSSKEDTLMKKSESANTLGSQNQVKNNNCENIETNNRKSLSKSDPHLDNYDPFKSAEQQMRELELDIVDIGLINPMISKSNDNIENLQLSPSSAFVKYSPVHSLPSPNNNESTFPEQYLSNSNLNRHPLHSLSNLSLCSIVSLESADFNNKTHSAVVRGTDFIKSPLKRSVSHNPKKHIGIENMLYGDNTDNKDPSELKFDLAEQELLKSVSEFENLLKLTDDDDIISPSLNRNSALSMINGVNSNSSVDSAYGSLNRKVEEKRNLESSSMLPKYTKFCHECGSKYPIVMAKFCSECGVRRIFL